MGKSSHPTMGSVMVAKESDQSNNYNNICDIQ